MSQPESCESIAGPSGGLQNIACSDLQPASLMLTRNRSSTVSTLSTSSTSSFQLSGGRLPEIQRVAALEVWCVHCHIASGKK